MKEDETEFNMVEQDEIGRNRMKQNEPTKIASIWADKNTSIDRWDNNPRKHDKGWRAKKVTEDFSTRGRGRGRTPRPKNDEKLDFLFRKETRNLYVNRIFLEKIKI